MSPVVNPVSAARVIKQADGPGHRNAVSESSRRRALSCRRLLVVRRLLSAHRLLRVCRLLAGDLILRLRHDGRLRRRHGGGYIAARGHRTNTHTRTHTPHSFVCHATRIVEERIRRRFFIADNQERGDVGETNVDDAKSVEDTVSTWRCDHARREK